MELRLLKYFVAVVNEKSISAAAEALHITQPTLSRQLKDLEEEVGKTLLIRGSRQISLTPDGITLLKRAKEIIDLVERTKKELSYTDNQISGDIYIGSGETDGIRQIAKVSKKLQSKYPNIHLHIISGDSMDIYEHLDKGLLDFGIILGDIDKTKYNYIKLPMKDLWGVLMRIDSPLSTKPYISPEDLWDKPLILSRQSENKSSLYNWLKKDPIELNTVGTYNLIYNASLLVDEGVGYALTLDKLINTSGSNICFRPLTPKLELGMYLVWKKHISFSKATEIFMKYLQEVLEDFIHNIA